MLTNHGPLVKVRPSAAVVGIPFKRQGSLDGGQLPNVLAGQVQWELLSLSYPRSWLAFYLVAHVGTSPGNVSLPFLHRRGTTNTIMFQGKKKWKLSSWLSDSWKHLLLWQVQHYQKFLIFVHENDITIFQDLLLLIIFFSRPCRLSSNWHCMRFNNSWERKL